MSAEQPSLPARYAAMVAQLKRSNERIETLERRNVMLDAELDDIRRRIEALREAT